MPSSLFDNWKAGEFRDHSLKNIVGIFAGGELIDGSARSNQFRKLLSEYCTPEDLERFARDALNPKRRFDDSGLALQDIVNEIGRRLDFSVQSGLYRGTPLSPGWDGLWQLERSKRSLVVEVKTTGNFLIELDTIAKYRTQLIADGGIPQGNEAAMLLVVGRGDTEQVENQIRGSRYAWDMRLISVESLLNLMSLKMESDNPGVTDKIHNLLFPTEFTRLDKIVEMAFTATSHIVAKIKSQSLLKLKRPAKVRRNEAISKVEKYLNVSFTQQKSAGADNCFISKSRRIRIVCFACYPIKSSANNHYLATIPPCHWPFLEGASGSSYGVFHLDSRLGTQKILLIPGDKLLLLRPTLRVDKQNNKHKEAYRFPIFPTEEGLILHRKASEGGSENLNRFLIYQTTP